MTTDHDTTTPNAVATTYFEAWRDHDWDTLRGVLHEDVDFVGVMGTARGPDECIAGLRGMAENVLRDLRLHVRVADGIDVLTWFDLVTLDGAVIPTANWSPVEHGRITRIRVTFDPTPMRA